MPAGVEMPSREGVQDAPAGSGEEDRAGDDEVSLIPQLSSTY